MSGEALTSQGLYWMQRVEDVERELAETKAKLATAHESFDALARDVAATAEEVRRLGHECDLRGEMIQHLIAERDAKPKGGD